MCHLPHARGHLMPLKQKDVAVTDATKATGCVNVTAVDPETPSVPSAM